jgi:hypothetical protein
MTTAHTTFRAGLEISSTTPAPIHTPAAKPRFGAPPPLDWRRGRPPGSGGGCLGEYEEGSRSLDVGRG